MKKFVAGAAVFCAALVSGAAIMAEEKTPPIVKFSTVANLIQDKCMACHTKGYDLPFYAKVPGIREIIEKDYRDGLRAMDLNLELVLNSKDKPVSETVLSKMEYVIKNDTMPPAKFALVHWGSRLNTMQRQEILDWIKQERAKYYATDAAPKHANEPLQPLPQKIPGLNLQKVALGDKLFNDKRLSADNTLSCAGCHFYDRGGTDHQRFSEGIRKQFGDVNPPTVFNAAFNKTQFWDGRAADLQEQAGGPPLNPIEMGSKTWDEIIAKLAKDDKLTQEFTAVYPDGWNEKNITDAIAEYEKTLITPNSRFDKWLRGDDKALTPLEVKGYERFKAYRCASCHVGKNVGGQSFEFMDLKQDYFKDRSGELGSDKGRFNVTKDEFDLHRFKVPSLRNIELTYPYMHDGTVNTLDDAVRIMGQYCSGIEVPPADREAIVAFLRTLTGEHPMLSGAKVEK